MKAVNIEWDIDDNDVLLPAEVDIPEYITDEDEISDYLSDLTGYCHKGFELVESHRFEGVNKYKKECEMMIGSRVKIVDNGTTRYGTVVDFLSKENTKKCMMFGQLIRARMDDTGADEEFQFNWELED